MVIKRLCYQSIFSTAYLHFYVEDGMCALGNNRSVGHQRRMFHHVLIFFFLLRRDKMINNKCWWRQNRKREGKMTFSSGTHQTRKKKTSDECFFSARVRSLDISIVHDGCISNLHSLHLSMDKLSRKG